MEGNTSKELEIKDFFDLNDENKKGFFRQFEN